MRFNADDDDDDDDDARLSVVIRYPALLGPLILDQRLMVEIYIYICIYM